MIKTEPNKDHQYVLRSCLNCKAFKGCLAEQNHKDKKDHCDFGKYGCIDYNGEHINEISKDELMGINRNKDYDEEED